MPRWKSLYTVNDTEFSRLYEKHDALSERQGEQAWLRTLSKTCLFCLGGLSNPCVRHLKRMKTTENKALANWLSLARLCVVSPRRRPSGKSKLWRREVRRTLLRASGRDSTRDEL